MRTVETEIFDRSLTRAINRYMEMSTEQICQAIIIEWPQQISVLLVELFVKNICPHCGSTLDLIHCERESGDSTYVNALCHCTWTPSS